MRGGRNTRDFELAEQFVDLGVSTISLVYLNKHIGLIVRLRGEYFEFLVGMAVLRMMRTVMIRPAVSIPRERRATLRKGTSFQKYYSSQDSCTIGNIWVDGEEVGNKLTLILGQEYYERDPGTALRSINRVVRGLKRDLRICIRSGYRSDGRLFPLPCLSLLQSI
jgi:hypothetical protein